MEEFCLALGYFVSDYADAEYFLKLVAKTEIGMSEPTAKVLFSGQRVKPIIDTIRKINEANNTELSPGLDSAFVQFLTITDMRDKLLHQGFKKITAHEFVTSNSHLSFAESRTKTYPITVEVIEKMRIDVKMICCVLVFHSLTKKGQKSKSVTSQEFGYHGGIPSWQYKSPSPKTTSRKSQQVHQNGVPQQKSSP